MNEESTQTGIDPLDDHTLLTLHEAAILLGYKDGSSLRRAVANKPPTLRTLVLGKNHHFTTPAWLHDYHIHRRKRGRQPRKPKDAPDV
jgi:hypothetical protein